jgi:hypothetical protein
MKTKITALLLALSMFVLGMTSCEQEQAIPGSQEALEGEWVVDENSQFYKRTASNVYNVYISFSLQDSTALFISNFYQLGHENEVRATLDDNRIQLEPEQQVTWLNSTYEIVEGTGVIASDYQSIRWNYQVDDGSGQIDHVTGTYSRKDK